MTVIKSEIVEDSPQADGRRYITERHTLEDGTFEDVTYLAEEKSDAEAMLSTRAAQIDERIAADEQAGEARAAAEKARAVALLELADPKLAAVLMVPVDEVSKHKEALNAEAVK